MRARPLIALSIAVGVAGCMGVGTNNVHTSNTGSLTTTGGVAPVNISQTDALTFNPNTVQAAPGQQIVFSNVSTMLHSATGDATGGPNSDSQFPSGMPPSASYTFTVPANATAGSKIFFHCRFHGAPGNGTTKGLGMAGEIDVQ